MPRLNQENGKVHINDLLKLVVEKGASDLHMKVRRPPVLRVNGQLVVQADLPELTPESIAQAFFGITTEEQRTMFARDLELDFGLGLSGVGRFRVNASIQRGTTNLSLRVVPNAIPSLDDLMLPKLCKDLALKQYGLVLITGPTGSGKSTTLASMVEHLNNTDSRRIVTIEDPIEYLHRDKQCFISQRELSSDTKSFSIALRHALRQDPDVILLGEMRDEETAQIAVQAALTGHLVLSSVHANDAVGALFRFLYLGVEPFLLSSALVGVVAQRMVRRVCPYCSVLREPEAEEKAACEQEMEEVPTRLHYGAGCDLCAQTGYLGRTCVFEVMAVTEKIRRQILSGASSDEIHAQAIKEGMTTMRHDGMLKVREGITTPYEVLRSTYHIS